MPANAGEASSQFNRLKIQDKETGMSEKEITVGDSPEDKRTPNSFDIWKGSWEFAGVIRAQDNLDESTAPGNNETITTGSSDYEPCDCAGESAAAGDLTQYSEFPQEMVAQLSQKTEQMSLKELCSIEEELLRFLESENKSVRDEWYAYAMLAEVLKRKLSSTDNRGKGGNDEFLRCLGMYEKSFEIAGEATLQDCDIDMEDRGKSEYLTLLHTWINENIDSLLLEPDNDKKLHNIIIIEEKLAKGTRFGDPFHENFEELIVKLEDIRGILAIYGAHVPDGDGVFENYESGKAPVNNWIPKKYEESNDESRLENQYAHFGKTPQFKAHPAFGLVVFGIFCLVAAIAYFIMSSSPVRPIITTKTVLHKRPVMTISPIEENARATDPTLKEPQANPQQVSGSASFISSLPPDEPNSIQTTGSVLHEKVDSPPVTSVAIEPSAESRDKVLDTNKDNMSEKLPLTTDKNKEMQERSGHDSGQFPVEKNDSTIQGDSASPVFSTNQSVSSTVVAEKHTQRERRADDTANNCGALYIKISLGKILSKDEAKFLEQNCN